MKTVKSIVLATSIILLSVSGVASASPTSGINSKSSFSSIELNGASTKQAAFQIGTKKLAQLRDLSSNELGLALRVHGDIQGNTVHMNNGTYVTVEERMDSSGNMNFVSMVNVGYHYLKPHDDNK